MANFYKNSCFGFLSTAPALGKGRSSPETFSGRNLGRNGGSSALEARLGCPAGGLLVRGLGWCCIQGLVGGLVRGLVRGLVGLGCNGATIGINVGNQLRFLLG